MVKLFEKPKEKCTVKRILLKGDYYQPIVHIDITALQKMKQYVDQSKKEIGWLGFVETINNEYFITDVELVEQTVSSVTTDLSESGLQTFAEQLLKEKRYEDLDKIRCWGHSHVNMDVQPSGQDNETFEEYFNSCPFFIRIIANKNGKLKLDFADRERELLFTNIDWKVNYATENAELLDEIERLEVELNALYKKHEDSIKKTENSIKDSVKKEIKTKVKEKCTYGTYNMYKNKKKQEDDESVCYVGNYLKKDEPCFKVYKDTNIEGLETLTEIFTDKEINLIAGTCGSGKDLKTWYEEEEMFIGWNDKDWNRLFDACVEYEKENSFPDWEDNPWYSGWNSYY